MTIEQLGSLGEFIASIATLVTLIYLAVQIRQNSEVVRTSNYWQISVLTNDFLRQIAGNAELNLIYLRGLKDYSGLSVEEQSRFHLLMSELFNGYLMLYQLHGRGLVDEVLFRSQFNGISTLLSAPGLHQWWADSERWYEQDFADHIRTQFLEPAAAQQSAAADSA